MESYDSKNSVLKGDELQCEELMSCIDQEDNMQRDRSDKEEKQSPSQHIKRKKGKSRHPKKKKKCYKSVCTEAAQENQPLLNEDKENKSLSDKDGAMTLNQENEMKKATCTDEEPDNRSMPQEKESVCNEDDEQENKTPAATEDRKSMWKDDHEEEDAIWQMVLEKPDNSYKCADVDEKHTNKKEQKAYNSLEEETELAMALSLSSSSSLLDPENRGEDKSIVKEDQLDAEEQEASGLTLKKWSKSRPEEDDKEEEDLKLATDKPTHTPGFIHYSPGFFQTNVTVVGNLDKKENRSSHSDKLMPSGRGGGAEEIEKMTTCKKESKQSVSSFNEDMELALALSASEMSSHVPPPSQAITDISAISEPAINMEEWMDLVQEVGGSKAPLLQEKVKQLLDEKKALQFRIVQLQDKVGHVKPSQTNLKIDKLLSEIQVLEKCNNILKQSEKSLLDQLREVRQEVKQQHELETDHETLKRLCARLKGENLKWPFREKALQEENQRYKEEIQRYKVMQSIQVANMLEVKQENQRLKNEQEELEKELAEKADMLQEMEFKENKLIHISKDNPKLPYLAVEWKNIEPIFSAKGIIQPRWFFCDSSHECLAQSVNGHYWQCCKTDMEWILTQSLMDKKTQVSMNGYSVTLTYVEGKEDHVEAIQTNTTTQKKRKLLMIPSSIEDRIQLPCIPMPVLQEIYQGCNSRIFKYSKLWNTVQEKLDNCASDWNLRGLGNYKIELQELKRVMFSDQALCFFSRADALLKAKGGNKTTIAWMFHGFSDAKLDNLLSTGLKNSMAERFLWGRGIYMTSNPLECLRSRYTKKTQTSRMVSSEETTASSTLLLVAALVHNPLLLSDSFLNFPHSTQKPILINQTIVPCVIGPADGSRVWNVCCSDDMDVLITHVVKIGVSHATGD